jgi:N-acetylglucosaminyldiphosphoundecaprenol N-acetyl-beta-D-mannosaminyltransferase
MDMPTLMQADRFPILGIPVHLYENYRQTLCDRLAAHLGTHVVTLNAEMTMQARDRPELAKIINRADLVIPDGAGIVLYLKLYGKNIDRVPGIELSESLLNHASQTHDPVFFYGGAPEVAAQAASAMQAKYPGLQIAGTESGFVTPEQMPAFCDRLAQLQPRMIYVGLGVPRQELWIAQHQHLCPHAVWIGIGGSFDIWAGTKDRAPQWLCDRNLEWTYRLYQEPWRWKRMMALPKFAWRSIVYRITGR